jgi:hypothetical protein
MKMKHRIAFLAAAVALAALPLAASAATLKHDTAGITETTVMTGPAVAAGDNDTMDIVNAEHGYLAEVCPSVIANPGNYPAALANFCRQPRG